MKSNRILSVIILALFVLAMLPTNTVQAVPTTAEIDPNAVFVPGEVVVTFPDGQTARQYRAKASALAGGIGAAVVRQYENMALLSFSPEADVTAVAGQINAGTAGVMATPNYVYKTSNLIKSNTALVEPEYSFTTDNGDERTLSWKQAAALRSIKKGYKTLSVPTYPNEFTSGNLWAWNLVQADLIWSDTNANPLVCLLDTGVDDLHPDLSGKITRGYDFFNLDSVPNDDSGHGTHLAGIITAKTNNGDQTAAGVSNSKVLAVKVAGAEGYSTGYTISAGLRYCANNLYVKVINISMGNWDVDWLLYNNLNYAINTKGKLVVIAAGDDSRSSSWSDSDIPAMFPAGWADPNMGWDSNGYPAYDPNGYLDIPDNPIAKGIISVAAAQFEWWPWENGDEFWVWVDSNENDEQDEGENRNFRFGCATTFSNYGRWVTMVAPGAGIYSSTPVSYPFYENWYHGLDSGYGWTDGTSNAAAFVAGAAARVWSINKLATNSQVKSILVENGWPLDDILGWGMNLLVVDESVVDPANAYWDNESGKYGWEEGFGIRAPYCWPTAAEDGDDTPNPFGPMQDMSKATYPECRPRDEPHTDTGGCFKCFRRHTA
jgi:hypothetical protein